MSEKLKWLISEKEEEKERKLTRVCLFRKVRDIRERDRWDPEKQWSKFKTKQISKIFLFT